MEQDILPEYRRPPIIEVVCGVQFEELKEFRSVFFGELWNRLRKNYPKTEDHPPLLDVFEGKRQKLADADFMEVPPLRRVFYVDSSGNFLLQVQPTRFLANWRKQDFSDEYPRFTKAYEHFEMGWSSFLGFIAEIGATSPETNQYELTYINHIDEGASPYPIGIADRLPLFSWKAADFLPRPRSVHFRLQFSLPESAGTLHVTASHGKRQSDGKPVLILDLTARGPISGNIGMKDWFWLAHEWIVRGFTDLTSAEAHKEWERVI